MTRLRLARHTLRGHHPTSETHARYTPWRRDYLNERTER